ncbi:acyl carrier protein [Parvibaculaceae bacterium PLY_AMNH_Bact1]|nr:acyl carrier protein [Parvibaculaceae bacterium PLY_AMNH_Bact1]
MKYNAETFARVCAVISEELGCSVTEITSETTAEDVNGWDSLAHARLIMALEDTLGVRFPGEKLFELDCIDDLVSLADEALKLTKESTHDLA